MGARVGSRRAQRQSTYRTYDSRASWTGFGPTPKYVGTCLFPLPCRRRRTGPSLYILCKYLGTTTSWVPTSCMPVAWLIGVRNKSLWRCFRPKSTPRHLWTTQSP